MRTLGFFIVAGALAYYYLMTPDVVKRIVSTPPSASAQSIQQEAKEHKDAVVEEQGENGDHLFEGLTG